jgi:hypothetical protein
MLYTTICFCQWALGLGCFNSRSSVQMDIQQDINCGVTALATKTVMNSFLFLLLIQATSTPGRPRAGSDFERIGRKMGGMIGAVRME